MHNKSDVVLDVKDVSLDYRKPTKKVHGFKEFIIYKLRGENLDFVTFHSLKSVSLSVLKGECVGLIGHNGSGKSSLLKVVAGIFSPKTGYIQTQGRITSLIELQAGFDPELSAVDNIYLTCSLMGISRKETKSRMVDIINFSEIVDFIDLPAKNYSSGMYAKLGFACATMVEPDLLLVDEVLAVGDERFQQKCYNQIQLMKKQRKSILFVTHDMLAIKKFCDKVYVLHQGELSKAMNTSDAINLYRTLASCEKRSI